MVKRLYDIVLSAWGLVTASPVLLTVAIAIKLEGGGSILFRQVRVGRHGRHFTLVKFRSMRADPAAAGPSITRQSDPRITRVGRVLRRSKLDELPQLWNVLVGDMSLVGPRPELPRYVALYTADQRRVLASRPGLTDLATLEFRDEERLLESAEDPEQFYVQHCIPRKLELSLEYASQATIWTDTKLLARTVLGMCRPRSPH
jgi:lipopolysaccharide/colanic/teichoic acid biosynthesis glycosyltransferase